MDRAFGWLGWTVLLGALMGVVGACEDEPIDTSCIGDSDCKKVDDCCEGCLAVHVSQLFPACDSQCVQSACMSSGQDGHVAVCKSGTCTLKASVTN